MQKGSGVGVAKLQLQVDGEWVDLQVTSMEWSWNGLQAHKSVTAVQKDGSGVISWEVNWVPAEGVPWPAVNAQTRFSAAIREADREVWRCDHRHRYPERANECAKREYRHRMSPAT